MAASPGFLLGGSWICDAFAKRPKRKFWWLLIYVIRVLDHFGENKNPCMLMVLGLMEDRFDGT